MRFPLRSKLAAVVILFFLGISAGQFSKVLETVRGNVERGARITDELRSTVTTLRQIDTAALEAQIYDLQRILATGTATPAQVSELKGLVSRLKGVQGPAGSTGKAGPPGPAGPAVAPSSSTTTATSRPGGTTATTRPPTATTTRPATTTTTRCAVGVGRLLKVGC